ncbi:MAG: PA0069 family radical SAM protein [Burkholderiales bacterium]|nr:PA0069 family radical SAM protein [Burkholderiales bacterium]
MRTLSGRHADPRKGRGAGINPEGRFELAQREAFDDGWESAAREEERPLKTVVTDERAKSVIARNDSPDIPFTQSINPYQGCEHGCIYCYARPSHAYRNLSPGTDFETRIFAKVNAPELLRRELSKPGYRCELIALGANTDPYQPAERGRRITRGILEVCAEFNQPVGIVTKNALVERDIDILAPMAAKGLAEVFVSVTTLDSGLARRMEPRCSAPLRRLQVVRALADAGIPAGVMVAPVVPFLNDHEIEAIVAAAAEHGARRCGYILMRLPYEVKTLFREWLERHYPLKAAHVMSRVHALRGGRDNDPGFGSRMRGTGEFATLLARRFDVACKKAGLNQARRGEGIQRDTSQFRVPGVAEQGQLF